MREWRVGLCILLTFKMNDYYAHMRLGFAQHTVLVLAFSVQSLLQSLVKVLRHFAFLGHSTIHTSPTPPLSPQTTLDASIHNFFRVLTLYRVGGGRTARKLRKGCTVLRGNPGITEQYEYCITVPRTFVHDCRLDFCHYQKSGQCSSPYRRQA